MSIGNVTMGGVGKTPFVVYLSRLLLQKGKRPLIVSRGYMPRGSSSVDSDEVSMLKEILPGVPVLAGKDRVKNMMQAESVYSDGIFVLDDGFQHWKVARDLDIVLIDTRMPFGNGCLIPAGVLREPLFALRRATGFVLTHCGGDKAKIELLKKKLSLMNPSAFIMETIHAVRSVTDLFQQTTTLDLSCIRDKVAVCTAIARPDSFIASIKSLGGDIRHQEVFMDHHMFTSDEVAAFVECCRKNDICKVIVTHKDAVKLAALSASFEGISVFVLNMEIKVIYGETEFISRITRLLDA